LSLKEKKIQLDSKVCVGCGECILSCPQKVFQIPWNEGAKELQEKMVEYAAAILTNKRAFYINFINYITKACDCFRTIEDPELADIGIVAGTDPVAVDQASYDLVNKAAGRAYFTEVYPDIDPTVQLAYAQALGIGSREYTLLEHNG